MSLSLQPEPQWMSWGDIYDENFEEPDEYDEDEGELYDEC